MRKITLMVIPDGTTSYKQIKIPVLWIYAFFGVLVPGLLCLTFMARDYVELKRMQDDYVQVVNQNESYRGEAKALVAELEDVKKSLRRVEDFSIKLQEIVNIQTSTVAKQTGIGPLTDEEYEQFTKHNHQAALETTPTTNLPLGINIDTLNFKPVFDKMQETRKISNNQALDMQKLLAKVSQQKYLLNSVPSIVPVEGWISSGYGKRVSPFTGKLLYHKGLDVASPVGTPIITPADGVVLFSGVKSGFGNFIMIAHGYGVITRFGHNSQNLVQVGQKVKRGEQIATVGDTGRSTGPHLHYEVWVNGRPVNPEKFILNVP